MANGDNVQAGMNVSETQTALIESTPYPNPGAVFLARNRVIAGPVSGFPKPWPTEYIGLQGEGTTGVLGISDNSPGPGVAGLGYWPDSHGVYGSGGLAAVWGNGLGTVLPNTTALQPGALVGVRGDAIDNAGVFGTSWNGFGVLGQNELGGAPGVRGESDTGGGVQGISKSAPGVIGDSGQE